MRVLRVTTYDPYLSPLTAVMREEDLKVPIEEAAAQQTIAGKPLSDVFVVSEIFEMSDGGIGEASLVAQQRFNQRFDREKNMAILYYWDAGVLLSLKEGGVLTTDRPAPLSAADVRFTFEQLAQHSNYRGQRVMCHTEDNQIVTLLAGKIL